MLNRTRGSSGALWLVTLLVLLAIFGLRLASIETTYMREDEEIAFRTTSRDLGYTVWYQAEQDVHAPVWFASFWAWQQVAGSTEFTGRIYSILLSMLALALVYQVGRRWFGQPACGLFAVALVGVNAYAHIYSLEIRPYALVMLLATLNMLLFHRWLVRPTWTRALAYGASVALMLWTHYFLAFLVLAQVAYVLLALLMPAGSTVRAASRLVKQGLGAAAVALLLWLPWLPVFVGQVETLRQIETENDMFRGLGIGNTTEPTTLDAIWRLVLLMTNGLPVLYGLALLVGLVLVWQRSAYLLVLAWALGVPAINLAVNLVASVYTPRYLSYVSIGVALAVGAALATLPSRWRWITLAAFCAISLWAMPSQLPLNRTPLRPILQSVSANAEPGDAVYFAKANEADLFVRWQLDHYLSPELRAVELDEFEDALNTRAVWFITGAFFDPEVQEQFKALEATHPLQAVSGGCNREWCFLAQRLLGPPENESVIFGDALAFYGVDEVDVEADAVTARLWWGAEDALSLDYSISLQLLDAQGALIAQSDGPLNPDLSEPRQTSQLEPGHVYTDSRRLPLPAPLDAGEYALAVVVYRSWDGIRLTLQSGLDTLVVQTITNP